MKEPMRIQIALYDRVITEAIVEDYRTAQVLWFEWCKLRYARNKPMGCVVINRADLAPLWSRK